MNFFQNLYKADTSIIETFSCKGMFLALSNSDQDMLSAMVTNEKVRQ